MNDFPWIGVERWKNGEIRTKLAVPFFILLGFSVLLIAVSVPILASEWTRLIRYFQAWVVTDPTTFKPELLLFTLPLGWLLTLKPLYRYWWQWRQYNGVHLTLDPYPGSVGGQVGGYLSIPARWNGQIPVVVRLNCVRVSASGSGESRSRSEKVHWRKRADVRATPTGADSTRIEFLVDVDDGLPSSDVKRSDTYIYWSVRIQLAGSGFDQSFEIPVFDTGRPQESKLRLRGGDSAAQQRSVSDISKLVADVRETDSGFAIDFPPGRSGVMGAVLAIVGLCMGLVAGFMWFQAYLEFSAEKTQYFALLVSSMIALGFSLFAVPLFLGGIYVRTNQLYLILDEDWLMVERRAFGRHFRKLISTDDIHDLDKTVTAQSGQGASAEVYYAIRLETRQGRKISIADDIPGQEDADVLLDFMRSKIRLHPEKTPRAMGKLPLPAWAAYVFVSLKLLSALVVLATVAAFVADFMSMT